MRTSSPGFPQQRLWPGSPRPPGSIYAQRSRAGGELGVPPGAPNRAKLSGQAPPEAQPLAGWGRAPSEPGL